MRLTADEMAERHRLGLCFNCNEKYTCGHNRFCRRIFWEGVEIDDAADVAGDAEHDAEAPCFSLQAVAGTMHVVVALSAASLVALLDSGSTALRSTSSPTSTPHSLGRQRQAGHLQMGHPQRTPARQQRVVTSRSLRHATGRV